jgi:hypothetical protein
MTCSPFRVRDGFILVLVQLQVRRFRLAWGSALEMHASVPVRFAVSKKSQGRFRGLTNHWFCAFAG